MEHIKTYLNLRNVSLIGLLISVGCTYPIWLGNEVVPRFPIVSWLDISDGLSSLLFAVVALSGSICLLGQSKKAQVICLLAFFISVLCDWNKAQPYFYMFCIVLLLDVLDRKQLPTLVLVMLFGVYVWSGVQKMNPYYFSDISSLLYYFPIKSLTPIILTYLHYLPFIEVFLGLLLILKVTRKYAHYIGVVLHVGTSVYLIIIGYDHIVIPWNLVMATFHIHYITVGKEASKWMWYKGSIGAMMSVVSLCIVLPIVNIITPHFSYLSWNLYSYRVPFGEVYIDSRQIEDFSYHDQLEYKIKDGYALVDLTTTSIRATHVAISPETWIYKQWFNHLESGINAKHANYLFIYFYTFKEDGYHVETYGNGKPVD